MRFYPKYIKIKKLTGFVIIRVKGKLVLKYIKP